MWIESKTCSKRDQRPFIKDLYYSIPPPKKNSNIDDLKNIFIDKIKKMIEEMINRMKTKEKNTKINWLSF